MFLDIWSFVTISLTALLMGSTFGHVLEMPAKLKFDGPLWMTLQQTLYRTFATVRGFIEIGAILATLVLVFLVRENRQAFYLSLIAAISLVAAFFVVCNGNTRTPLASFCRWLASARCCYRYSSRAGRGDLAIALSNPERRYVMQNLRRRTAWKLRNYIGDA